MHCPFLEVDTMKISDMAINNIKGNLHRYIMYYLSNSFAVTVFFIFANFVFHPSLDTNNISPSATAAKGATSGLVASQVIIVIFSILFVGYSTSIFLKSRGKEFGLLSLYGMTRRQIKKICAHRKYYYILAIYGNRYINRSCILKVIFYGNGSIFKYSSSF